MPTSRSPHLDPPYVDQSDKFKRSPQANLLFDIPLPRPEHVQQFKRLYRQRFQETLRDEQALKQLISLLAIFRYQQESTKHQAQGQALSPSSPQ